MKESKKQKKNLIGKRVRKVQGKARRIGFWYVLGTIALLALVALFPVVMVSDVTLGATTFYTPFLNMQEGLDIPMLAACVSYGLLLLVLVVNALKSIVRFFALLKNNSRTPKTYNKTASVLQKVAKGFSSSFAAAIILTLQALLLQDPTVCQINVMNAYIILGVGAFVHFFAGIRGGKVSRFRRNETGMIEEETRVYGRFVYFLRNLVQFAVTGAIVYYLVTCNQIYTILGVLNQEGGMDMNALIPAALQLVTFLCTWVLIKHTTAATEFNLHGIDGRGMKNFRVFAFFTFVLGAALAAWGYISTQQLATEYVIIAAAAFVGFLFDCIVKSKSKDVEEEEEYIPAAWNPQTAMPQTPVHNVAAAPQTNGAAQPVYVPVYYPYPQPVQQPVYVPTPVQQPVYVPTPVQQPVYVPTPVPTPVHVPAPAPAPAPAPVTAPAPAPAPTVRPEPAPAPDYLRPTPSPAAIEAGATVEEEQKTKKELRAEKLEAKRAAKQEKKAAKLAAKASKKDGKAAKAAAKEEAKKQKAEKQSEKQAAKLAKKNAKKAAKEAKRDLLAANAVEENETDFEEETIDFSKIVPTPAPTTTETKKTWAVKCPQCGKELNVNDKASYHRCPSCSKIFTLRKFETLTKRDV